jgi:sterol 3beta-glucosyltransferase
LVLNLSPGGKLTPENLADVIKTAVIDQDLRRRAADLGERIRAEDGSGNAVKLIIKYNSSITAV